MTNDVARILRLAASFAAAKGWSLSTVSLRIAGHGGLFLRLQGGGGLTLNRRDRIIQKFSEGWPEGLDWPSDIPRPEPSGSEEAAS